MVAKIGLDCNPPIRGNAVDRALPCRIDAEGFLRIVRQGAIAAKLQIEQVVQEGITGEADDLLGIDKVNEGFGGRCRRQLRTDKGKAPDGCRVPDVLNCRAVVGINPPQQSVVVELDRLREPYICIIPSETAEHTIIRPLDERSEVVGESSAGKQAHLLEGKVVVGAEMGRGTTRLAGLGMGVCRRLERHRERRARPIPAVQYVAAQLEASAERCELPKSSMAGRARLAGLARVERQSTG